MLVLLGNSLTPTLRDYFTSRVTDEKNLKLLPASLGKFVSSEAFAEPQISPEDLKGQPVTIMQSLGAVGDHTPQDFLWQTLMTIRKLKEKGAGPIWVAMPFAAYGRQDREFDERMTSVAIDDLAFSLKQFGAEGVSTIEMHSDAGVKILERHFDKNHVFTLDPTELFANDARENLDVQNLRTGGPDKGANARADAIARALKTEKFRFKKQHIGVNKTEVIGFEGDVDGKDTMTIDDMIDGGGTIENSQVSLAEKGAKKRTTYATHPILSNGALERLFTAKTKDGEHAVSQLVVTDTIDIDAKLSALRRQYGEKAVDSRVRQISVGAMLFDHVTNDVLPHPSMTAERG
jgi:ribose-phosphate pyrophosphokinase